MRRIPLGDWYVYRYGARRSVRTYRCTLQARSRGGAGPGQALVLGRWPPRSFVRSFVGLVTVLARGVGRWTGATAHGVWGGDGRASYASYVTA
jgi:hypothetical protein